MMETTSCSTEKPKSRVFKWIKPKSDQAADSEKFAGMWKWKEEMDRLEQWPDNEKWKKRKLE